MSNRELRIELKEFRTVALAAAVMPDDIAERHIGLSKLRRLARVIYKKLGYTLDWNKEWEKECLKHDIQIS